MAFLMEQCSAWMAGNGSALLALFMAGLVGGFTHCAGMCGPFVATQVISRAQHLPPSHASGFARLTGAALLPYHLGRMTTYTLLGVAAATLTQQIIGTPLERGLSALLLTFAGVLFLAAALPVSVWRGEARSDGYVARFGAWIGARAKPLFTNPAGGQGYALGLMLGFLPCGLVFAALMIAAAMGDPARAGLGMVLFTLGTIPALFLIGYGSHYASRRWPNLVRNGARGVMALNGLGLFFLAGKVIS